MKAAREFISETTDIDSRLLRTIIGLFRNPHGVAKATIEGQPTYTKPLRYLLFTSTLFVVWRFIYEHTIQNLFVERYPENDGYLPERIAKATDQFINLEDNFFPFQILLFVVPLATVCIKLLFLSKSWREARYVALYSFGQFWMVLLVLVPVMAAFDTQLFPILIAFGLVGFSFRTLLAKKTWIGLAKWVTLGYVLTLWFYQVSLPVTHWALVQIVLPERFPNKGAPVDPVEKITMPSSISWMEPIVSDPDDRILAVTEKPEGLLVQCYQPDTILLWQTPLPGLTGTREALSVLLPSSERGILLLADASKKQHAVLISAKGKILFTKIYEEESVLNGGDLINETLVLAGGKSNGAGISPFIDVIRLTVTPESTSFKLRDEQTFFLPDVGYRFDDAHALANSTAGLDLVVSKYEITKVSETSAPEVNRFSIVRLKVDSTLHVIWETVLFQRTSKYWPLRDASFQMRYDPAMGRIVAFYSLADDRILTARLFSMDTLGRLSLQKKIQANEVTALSDIYSVPEGIYFCGQTHVGIRSPLLGLGSQGLIGFVSNDGKVSQQTVGKGGQGDYLLIYKIAAAKIVRAWGVRSHHVLWRETDLELMKFSRESYLSTLQK